jgi:hypothetical protein
MEPYKRSEALIDTIENKTKAFMNAETQYEKWLVFKEMVEWVEVLQENNYYLKNKD